VVTLGLLFAFKGVGNRAFYRWIKRDYLPLFPHLPERTRLFRLFAFAAAAHREWTNRFLAEPTIMGAAGASDTYGIELIHPIREGRSPRQIGRKGLSNRRWIEGVKLALVVNQWGLAVGWDSDTANHKDNIFRPLVAQYEEEMVVLTDTGFHTTPKKGGDPLNMKVCQPDTWNERMVIEDVFAMLTTVCHLKKIGHRVWAYVRARLLRASTSLTCEHVSYVRARLAFVVAAFNLLTQWNGLQPDEAGVVHLSIAQFTL